MKRREFIKIACVAIATIIFSLSATHKKVPRLFNLNDDPSENFDRAQDVPAVFNKLKGLYRKRCKESLAKERQLNNLPI